MACSQRWLVRAAIAMSAGIGFALPPAFAAFWGENGRIAYVNAVDPFTINARSAIFLTGSGQLTFPLGEFPLIERDAFPAWSPDGSKVAFVRAGAGKDYLMVIGKDGTGLRQIISSDSFPRNDPNGLVFAKFSSPTWSPDGQRIALDLRYTFSDHFQLYWGVWTVRDDGSGLTQLVREYHTGDNRYPDGSNWSPSGDEIVYRCVFRGSTSRPDLCVVNVGTRSIRQLPIDPPDLSVTNFSYGPGRPRWSPDGEKIVFAFDLYDSENIHRSEIFSVNADGTGLAAITHSPVACGGGGLGSGLASMEYFDPAPSPDGEWIAARARHWVGTAERCAPLAEEGLWVSRANGGPASLLVASEVHPTSGLPQHFISHPDWQPLPGNLVITIEDGHDNPLDGLKVELRTLDDTPVPATPINTAGGKYVFENGIPPGQYVLRATLIDHAGGPNSTPGFEIRYGGTATEPVWIDHFFSIADGEGTHLTIPFVDSPGLGDSNLPIVSRLDDVANIYFRVRQFVDWVKTRLTADTGQTVEYYTFATVDPWGDPDDPEEAGAYYDLPNTAIVMGVLESEYENRDGVTGEVLEYDANGVLIGGHEDSGPENSEWHEFTHHLFSSFVSDHGPQSLCDPNYVNHAGYDNPDTCDSMDEGFAAFLPTLAAQGIEGVSDADYANTGRNFDFVKYKPWGYRRPWDSFLVVDPTTEDYAVAGLFWDLVDPNAHPEITAVIGADGAHHSAVYHDQSSLNVRQLWNELDSDNTANVADLRRALGNPALTVDLDGDGVMDVAPIDEIFLMHGFFPIVTDQTITASHRTYHYDVALAQRLEPGLSRNRQVGQTAHRQYDAAGTLTKNLDPRYNTPAEPSANLEVHVLDPSGAPLGGATLDLAITYPGGREHTISRLLGTGDGAHVHIELPPYFDHLLPSGASLPPCDPAHDFQVQVALSATLDGVASPAGASFDNCAYQQAMAAATGPAALSFTLTVPVSGNVEVCDGIDNDLDGQIDEAVTDTYYRDADGDTFGSFFVSTEACTQPSGYVTDSDDCDDADASIHPGAAERCNGADDNCDAQTDEGVLTTFYLDADSDTYGDVSATTLACDLPAGYASAGTDCNDGDVSIHPEALEVCRNGLDENCDGEADEGCPPAYDFSGFFQPVDNPPTWNVAKAGSSIPVQFSLNGDHGLDVLAAGYPASGTSACGIAAPVDAVESTVTAGASSLTYDPTTDQYTYVWKTEQTWAGQCRQLRVTLTDGTTHVAYFQFPK